MLSTVVPSSDDDIEKTINLANQYLNGEYNFTWNDVPIFQETKADNYDDNFPVLKKKQIRCC